MVDAKACTRVVDQRVVKQLDSSTPVILCLLVSLASWLFELASYTRIALPPGRTVTMVGATCSIGLLVATVFANPYLL
jgi:hypothetical protein